MVRATSLLEDEEAHYSSSPTDCRRADPKVNNVTRSKHSETEQRRRSKINERQASLSPFPAPKRDKASFLLEVIQYIQFLQEKLHVYEGSCQGWSPEPSKLLPWKINSGAPVESFADQSHLDRNSMGPEDNAILNPSLLNDAHDSVDADLTGATLYNVPDGQQIPTNTLPLNMHLFGDLSSQHHEGGLVGSEHVTHQSQSHDLLMRAREQDCSAPDYPINGEELITDSGEAASISNNCSQRLLSSLVKALQSSGVDLSQSSISVQLDIGKQGHGNVCDVDYASPTNEEFRHPRKKYRSDQT
ncbi:hypothetical protein M569_03183 [Genlisea aurea]|uniref:BHLH domain-containing protein n=1 Tax=Genlisea aurea TaxID=192259 RepID=S8CXB7_9LAMI|nr:hypothetical protein M569_03183 [Genlisea aurea]